MPNALQQNNIPPTPPEINNAGDNGIQPEQFQSQQKNAPVTHGEAVAALRHFGAISQELETLLKNPQLGKADMKSAIIEGTTKLVADMLMSPGDAVATLATVPNGPREQRDWIVKKYQDTMIAEHNIIDHHRLGNQGTQDWSIESQMRGNRNEHLQNIASLMDHFKGKRHA